MDDSKKVLVVDDEERIRRLIRMYLERDELEVEEAENGAEALEMALENEYDVILLDIMMPEMDGIEVCEKIREKEHPYYYANCKRGRIQSCSGF